MKFPNDSDRHLAGQLFATCLLLILPIAIIAKHGHSTVSALLWDVDNSSELETVVRQQPERSDPLFFGVYDPHDTFAADHNFRLRHVYLSWAEFNADELLQKLTQLESDGFSPVLTVEPWPLAGRAGADLLEEIVQGEYDAQIENLAAVLSRLAGPTYVSWGHEMDQDLTERYPWSGKDSQKYVAAYRYVVDRLRRICSSNISWVWAGVIKSESPQYWPGDDYVDYVGMAVYSYPPFDQEYFGYIRDFRTTLSEKQEIVNHFGKPIIITELGVSGSPDFANFWLHQAFMSLGDFPKVAGIIFFYDHDTEGAWGPTVETPDWRVHPDTIRGLVNWQISSQN